MAEWAVCNSSAHHPSFFASFSAVRHGDGWTFATATRRFAAETGMTFGRWRQQLRLLIALERLGEGRPVTEVALDVGYEDTSAFIAVFKAAFGTTPSRYFAQGSSTA